MTRSLLFALALSAGVLAGSPALAAAASPATAKVHYGDLDLGSAQGSRTLERRIDRALRQVCEFNPQERQRALKEAAARCIAKSRAQIVLPQAVASRLAAR